MNILFLDLHKKEESLTRLNFHFLKELSQQKNLNLISVTHPEYHGILNSLEIKLYPATLKSKTDTKSIKSIRKIINKHSIDIIQCQNNRALANAILATIFSRKKPKIICRRGIIRKINKLDPSEWVTYLHPNYTHTIALTKAIKQDLITNSNFNKNSITTIYPALELDWLSLNLKFDSKKELNIPADAFIIGTVANFRPIKGLDIFIRAIEYINKLSSSTTQPYNFHYVFIGAGCEENLKHLILDKKLLARIHFLGPKENVCNYVKDFDLYIQPSRSEGCGLALVEAMLLGICPITSKVGGMVELVEHENTGLNFDPSASNSSEALAENILRLFKDHTLRTKLAQQAQAFAKDNFSLSKVINKHLALYKKITLQKNNTSKK